MWSKVTSSLPAEGLEKEKKFWQKLMNIKKHYLVITHTNLMKDEQRHLSAPEEQLWHNKTLWITAHLTCASLKRQIFYFYIFILSVNRAFLLLLDSFIPLRMVKSYRFLSVSLQRECGDNLVHKANSVSLHIQLSRSRLWSPSLLPNYAVIPAV